jgi:alanyl-tRNA synthetase
MVARIKAPDLIKLVGASVGAKGGGRPDMARAGGGDQPEALGAALQQVSGWVAGQLG